MKSISKIIIACLFAVATAVQATETTITDADSSPSQLSTATRQQHQQTASASAAYSDAQPTAETTVITSAIPSQTSVFAATTSISITSTLLPGQWNGGAGQGGNQIDTGAAAAGTGDGGGFHMSMGALIAVSVIVAVVVIFGIASLALWIMAKRRQMSMRESVSYATRRLTGRRSTAAAKGGRNAAARRTAVRFAHSSPELAGHDPEHMLKTPVRAVYPPGHKRGLVVNESDVEKGMGLPAPKYAWQDPLQGKVPQNPNRRGSTFLGRLWGNNWK